MKFEDEKRRVLIDLFKEKKLYDGEEKELRDKAIHLRTKKENWNRKLKGVLGVSEKENVFYDDLIIKLLEE